MRRQLILFMMVLLLAACGGETGTTGDANTTDDDPLPLATLEGTPDSADLTATAFVEQATEAGLPTAEGTISGPQLTSTALIAQATRGVPTEDCVLGISSDPAPDPAAQSAIQTALPDAEDVQVLVTTERLDCETINVVNAFTQITLPTISLNPETVGNIAADAINALSELTLPQPMTYRLVLTTGNDQRDLTFNGDQINDLLGLRGETLVAAIEG